MCIEERERARWQLTDRLESETVNQAKSEAVLEKARRSTTIGLVEGHRKSRRKGCMQQWNSLKERKKDWRKNNERREETGETTEGGERNREESAKIGRGANRGRENLSFIMAAQFCWKVRGEHKITNTQAA